MKNSIYIAGSLFTNKEIAQRIKDREVIEKAIGDKERAIIFNPIEQPFNDKANNNPTASDIFWGDTKAILTSDVISIDGDDIDRDSGVAFEAGMCFAINYMLDVIGSMNPNMRKDIEKIIPYKKAYTVVSDIRQDGKGEEGLAKAWGHNLFTYGGLQELGKTFRNIDEVAKEISKDLKEVA